MVFGSVDVLNVENWMIVVRYRGYGLDVIDIVWLLDDFMLASCSFDNLVIIWDCRTGNLVVMF